MSPGSSIAAAAAVLWLIAAPAAWQTGGVKDPARRMAVTIDDLPTVAIGGSSLADAERVTRDLLAALTRHRVPAIGFVNESKLQPDGRVDPRRVALLQRWIDAGLDLGNHTFSHSDLHRVPLPEFEQDVVAGEAVTRELMRKAGKELTYFRHPFLRTGRSSDTRLALEAFLEARGYVVAPVTVDNYDYLFAAAYDRAADPAGRSRIEEAYLAYMEAVVAYYEQQATAIIGREIAQTLLIHASALNAATFDRLAVMLKGRGYEFVSLAGSLKDPAYRSADAYYGPGGITWLHRWAITEGKPGSIFAGEPPVPEWIERAAR